MKNKELFKLNPDENNLINDGVVEINTSRTEENGLAILRYELSTFVCEGEYQQGIYRIMQSYLEKIEKEKQPAVWVSGFFGSGKSHLVKMLGYLWEDFKFSENTTARLLKPLPTDVNDLFTALDRKQKQYGRLAITGTLKDFPSSDIRYSLLQLILKSLELPTHFHLFKFVYWAKKEGIYDNLKTLVEAKGRNFDDELGNLCFSLPIAKSILELLPELAENESKILDHLGSTFVEVTSISRDQFIHTIRKEILPLFFGDQIPCTIIVLDEVQQFIGNDGNKTIDIQNLAQDICSNFDGKILLVGTGQNALSDTIYLQPLQDRFTVKVDLSDADVDTVSRKTVLEKNLIFIEEIDQTLNSGSASAEISRNLSGTDLGYENADKSTLIADYPIMPSTRKFWVKILKAIDTAGTSGQLRSQLRIINESIKNVANKDLGFVVPADFIFEQKQSQLLQNARLLNETNNLIKVRKAKGGDIALEGRILSAVFLIGLLPPDTSSKRLKSNENTIADLLIENLNVNSEVFRTKVKELINKLVEDKVLMPVGDEFKLQTKVGAEWEQEFTKQYVKINNSGDDLIQGLRKEKIVASIKAKTKTIIVTHGISKQVRDFELWDKTTMPNTEDKLMVWIRDGWFENETVVLNEIRAAGNDFPLAYVFVKKYHDAELRSEVLKYLAAKLTLTAMGLPNGNEGELAKKGMETRLKLADSAIDDLIIKINAGTVVYLAGGNKIEKGSVSENIQEAFSRIADRQFPEFKSKADFLNWGQALTRAVAGYPDALNAITYMGDVDKHPMSPGILHFIGNATKLGKDIRSQFMKSPYGWSQDAIDTMLIMLKNTDHISTTEPDLKVAKINQASFKRETIVISAKDKIAIKTLFQDAGIVCPPNQEIFPFSNMYLEKLKTLADQISGDAPRPEPFNIAFIKDIENKEGNERLLDIVAQKAELREKFEDWSRKANTVRTREPFWITLRDLATQASDSADLEQIKLEINAIHHNRLLLQEPDPIQPKLIELTDKLRTLLNRLKENYISVFDMKMAELQANEYFNKLSPDQKHIILVKHQILVKPEIKHLDAIALLNQLHKASLYDWETKIAALPGQFQSALDDAILLSAPQAKTFSLPRRTITSQAEIESYIDVLKTELVNLLKDSSSIILK